VNKSSLLAIVATLALGISTNVHAATCVATGFVRESVDLTAALINPPGAVGTILDATGCNIGIYYDGGNNATLDGADVFGASHYGVLVNTDNGGTSVISIKRSILHHIGDVPHSLGQYGVGISLRGFAGVIVGDIDGNQVFDYQKGGIAANGSGVRIGITGNGIIGDGHISTNAQNGIQVAFGASATSLSGNFVFGNSYSGDPGDGSSASGILIAGGPGFGNCPPFNAPCSYVVGARIRDNSLYANDVGVYVFNSDGTEDRAPSTATNIVVARNGIYGDLCYNKVFQAGVADVGNSDRILNNTIFGPGYFRCDTGTNIDILDAVNVIVRNRTSGPAKHPSVFRD
jgi:hypothetical protein